MILETLLGGAFGGALRLAPEILKFFDRKNERAHEVTLLDKNLEADKQRGAQAERQLSLQTDAAQITNGLQALMEAIKGQSQITGVAWVDALNNSVRPVLTYGIALPYVIGKFLVFVALLWAGNALDAGMVKVALEATYTGADMGILSGVLNFWFLGRVFDKRS